MKKRKSSLIVLLMLIVIIALLSVYKIRNYKGQENNNISNKIANNTVNENNNAINNNINNNSEEEINLGDIANCSKLGCADSSYTYNASTGNCSKKEYYNHCDGRPSNACPPGSWSSAHNCCWTQTSRTVTGSKVICTDCNDYYYENSYGTCSKCSITSVTKNKDIVSPGSTWKINSITYNDSSCTPYSGTLEKTATSSEACKRSTITMNYGDTKKTVSIRVAGEWEKAENGVRDNVMSPTKDTADGLSIELLNTTLIDYNVKMETGKCLPTIDGKYYCFDVWQRGICGSKPYKSYDYCCVNNQYVGVSSSAIWTEHVLVNHDQMKNGKYGCAYYYGDDYTYVNVSKDKCKVTEDVPGRCSTNSITLNKVDEQTTKCEENHKIKLYEGEKCTGTDLGSVGTDINTSFYSISCEKEINTNFDYGDDNNANTIRELYRGQGFKFGINATTKIRCDGTFYGTRWKNVYNKLWNKIENVESGLKNACSDFSQTGLTRCENYINGMHFNRQNTKKDVYELLTIIRELVEIVDTYNNYTPNMEYNEEAKINFKYTINGKTATKTVDEVFNKNIVNEGVYKATSEKTVNLGVSGLTNPKNYVKSNYGQPRVIKFTFKNVYIDKTDGTIKANPKEKLDGGNKLYIDYNADIQTISIKSAGIVVTGLAGNNSSVTDDKCTIKIKDQEILYRPIDVSNPFINSKWTPGVNWINSKFDFRNIIHADIWSK